MNKSVLIGRLTKAPELKRTNTNLAYCKFTLAVGRFGKSDKADFINCVAWKKIAENLVKYMGKGSQIGVVGNIQTGSYTNKAGVKVYTTEVNCEQIHFLDNKKERQENNNYNNTSNNNQDDDISPNNFISDDDMPF